MPPTTTFVRRAGVLHRHLTDGVLVLTPDGEQATALLGTAAELWEALARPATAHDIAAALAERFQGDPATIAEDVGRALRELAEAGLVEAQG